MSSNTSSPGVRPASNSDNNSDSVNFTALVVALVALVVALLQLILQYVLSAESRSKCSKAAIGRWSTKNKQYWRPWRAKLYIRYARPSISRKQFLAAVREQGTERHNNLEILDRFKVMEHLPSMSSFQNVYLCTDYHPLFWPSSNAQPKVAENKDGVEVTGVPQVILTRRGTEEATHVNINTLRGRERDAAMSLSKVSRRLFTPPPPTKATWCSLLCDLGLDLERLPGTGEMIDADTIPSVLDAPPL
ncbi:10344_t:CDS:2 [Acaulospora colombiana]|uniref:10344_t:CDS:1 n=1 Tax=Acaulospora colombiana TaxID=27376 RepID=A0ACA9MZF6_9GLOM|nr:10344_t:CDS:2 [Acaulospora colombiana]